MSNLKAPPTFAPLNGDDGKVNLPWNLFFDAIFKGDTGTTWIPTFTSLTITGTPTITGKYYRIGPLSYFRIIITPSTDTTSTAGTTYVNNFPVTMKSAGICFAVSGLLGSNSGMCDPATNRIYVPAWAAVTVPLYILGIVEAS